MYITLFESITDVVDLDVESYPLPELAKRYPSVNPGGQYSPPGCKSYQKVAIIVPYRNRLHHLKILLNRLHPMLMNQQIDYRIFIIEQVQFAYVLYDLFEKS